MRLARVAAAARRVVAARRGLRVGIVGAGNMGRGLAASVARAGHEVRERETTRLGGTARAHTETLERLRMACSDPKVQLCLL